MVVQSSKTRDCPNDIKEAISSLIFASARCGDIPELFVLRKLFEKRYGENFVTTAVELFPENHVNKQLKKNMSEKHVPEDLKYEMVDEIVSGDNILPQSGSGECCHCRLFYGDEENKGMELVIVPLSQKEENIEGILTRIKTEVPYSRAMTMPQERQRKSKDELRTYSCPSQYPNHVHHKLPGYEDIIAKFKAHSQHRNNVNHKLPDYDDIVAKFTALKRQYVGNIDC